MKMARRRTFRCVRPCEVPKRAVFERTPSARLSQAGFSLPLRPAKDLPEHPEHLLGGDDEQAEGQMRRHLDRSAHADMPPAVLLV